MTVKLHNKGQRTIHEQGCEFKPDAVMSFPDNVAEKLLKLFKGEVFDIERTVAVFEAAETFKAVEETQEEVIEEVKEETEEKRGRGRPPKA